jgi:ribosomal protein S10
MAKSNKATCPGSGLVALNKRNNPDTMAPLGDCPSCGLSYSTKLDNGIFRHVVQEPQLTLPVSPSKESPSKIVKAAKAMEAKPAAPSDLAEMKDSIRSLKSLHLRRTTTIEQFAARISYLEKRLDEAAKQFARIDKPWWKRW